MVRIRVSGRVTVMSKVIVRISSVSITWCRVANVVIICMAAVCLSVAYIV